MWGKPVAMVLCKSAPCSAMHCSLQAKNLLWPDDVEAGLSVGVAAMHVEIKFAGEGVDRVVSQKFFAEAGHG